MKKAQTPEALYQAALGLLARRDHATLELINKLKARTDCPDLIPDIISTLTEKNLLNDARFVESYSRMRAHRGYGKLRIQSELQERGIQKALSEANIYTSNINAIRKVREKKFGELLPIDNKEKAKQSRYLYYKGFSFDEIKRVLKNDDDE
jgi:regulatory protein